MNSQITTYSKAVQKSFSRMNWSTIGDNIMKRFFTIILATIIFAIILWLGKYIINLLYRQTKRVEILGGFRRTETFRALTLNIFRYTTYFCYLYAILSMIGVPVGTLIAGAGIFSIAVGLGAQGFVSDVVNGFFILLERQFDVGDIVKIGDIKGNVIGIGLRTTKILSQDGTITFIPNRSISIVQNLSRHDRVINVDIKIQPNTPIDKVRKVIEKEDQAIMEQEQVELKAAPEIIGPVNNDGQLIFRVAVHTTKIPQPKLSAHLLSVYLQALARAGICLNE